MFRIVNGSQNLLRLPLSAALIPGLFSPVFHRSPVCSENRVLPSLLFKGRREAGTVQQLRNVMYVITGSFSRRKIVLIGLSSDAGLQRTLHGITRYIVGARISPSFEEGVSIAQSFDRQGLEFKAIHPRHQDIAPRHSIRQGSDVGNGEERRRKLNQPSTR